MVSTVTFGGRFSGMPQSLNNNQSMSVLRLQLSRKNGIQNGHWPK